MLLTVAGLLGPRGLSARHSIVWKERKYTQEHVTTQRHKMAETLAWDLKKKGHHAHRATAEVSSYFFAVFFELSISCIIVLVTQLLLYQ